MIPILYPAAETEFTSNGLGALVDAESCKVNQEINGVYELSMVYPMTGLHFEDLENRAIIWAKPDLTSDEQPFRIYRIKKELSGKVQVFARHICFDMSGIIIRPFTAADIQDAMEEIPAHSLTVCPFTFSTERTVASSYTVYKPMELWHVVGNEAGSLLDVYGGEWEFDRYTAILHAHRGQNNGVSIRYGKNLTSLEQEAEIDACYTAVYPYWYDQETGDQVSGFLVYVPGSFDFERVLLLDCTEDFETAPTAAELTAKAQQYIARHDLGTPEVAWDISFQDLAQCTEYAGQGLLEQIALGDTVRVIFDELGVDATARAVQLNYNVLLDRYESIRLGSVKQNFAEIVVEENKSIEHMITKAESEIRSMIQDIEGNRTEIIQTAEAVSSVAVSVSGLQSDLEGSVETLRSEIRQTGEQITLEITQQSIQPLTSNVAELGSAVEEQGGTLLSFSEWFRFTAAGLIIGRTDSNIKLRLQNDTIIFFSGDDETAAEGDLTVYAKFSVSEFWDNVIKAISTIKVGENFEIAAEQGGLIVVRAL